MNNIVKKDILIRPLREDDKDYLTKWLSDPNVLEFYEGRDRPFNLELVEQKFYNHETSRVRCLIVFKNQPIGYMQYYELDEASQKEYGLVPSQEKIMGIDQFIGEPEFWNKGLGTTCVSLLVHDLTTNKGADFVVLDPQCRNPRAIRCYEKCGFKKIGILKNMNQAFRLCS